MLVFMMIYKTLINFAETFAGYQFARKNPSANLIIKGRKFKCFKA